MTDIVERLRDRYSKHSQELRDEAADEIERLQKELVETRKWRQQNAEFCDRARDERDYYRDKYHEQAALKSDDEIERLQATVEHLQDVCKEKHDSMIACMNEALVLRAALERIAEGCDLSNEAQAIAREALRDE